MSLVLLGDLVSLYMAVLRGVDPVAIARDRRAQGAARGRVASRLARPSRGLSGMSDTATSTRTAASIIDGQERTDAPGGRLESTNPANRSDVVAEVLLTDAHGLRRRVLAPRAPRSPRGPPCRRRSAAA